MNSRDANPRAGERGNSCRGAAGQKRPSVPETHHADQSLVSLWWLLMNLCSHMRLISAACHFVDCSVLRAPEPRNSARRTPQDRAPRTNTRRSLHDTTPDGPFSASIPIPQVLSACAPGTNTSLRRDLRPCHTSRPQVSSSQKRAPATKPTFRPRAPATDPNC